RGRNRIWSQAATAAAALSPADEPCRKYSLTGGGSFWQASSSSSSRRIYRSSRAGGHPGKAGDVGDALSPHGVDSPVNSLLVMRNEREDLVAVGPVSIEYQAAMIRDELEECPGWTTVGIARVLTEEQARAIAGASQV